MRRSLPLGTLVAALILGVSALAAPSATAVQVAQDRIVSANPSDITPNIIDPPHDNYHVSSIAQIGSRTYVAGEFTQIENAGSSVVYTVSGLFAFDTATGQIDTTGFGFPAVNGRLEVLAPSEDGQSLFVGGDFSQIDGIHTKKIASLDPATGAVITKFKASADNKVNDLVARGGLLYMGGTFLNVDGSPRSGIAAVDPVTGALSSELALPVTGTRLDRKPMHVDRIDVTPDASRLLISGNFTAVGGVTRGQLAMINLTTSPDTLANWATDRYTPLCATKFATYIRDIDFSPDGSYFVVATTGATAINHGGTPTSGPLCDSSARFETGATGSGIQPTWTDFVGGDTNYSVAITGTAVYLGGHQRWQNNYFGADSAKPGSVGRPGIAALSPLNGIPFQWNPKRVRGLGAQALLATGDGLFVGSDTDIIGGEYHAKLALMPLAGGELVPPAVPGSIPGELYTIQQNGQMVARSYDGTTFGSPAVRTSQDWSSVRGALMLSGVLYTGWSDGTFRRQTLADNHVGGQTIINQQGLATETQQPPSMGTQLSGATGMFWDPANGRLYYTVAGDLHLYYRAFLTESDLLGDYRYTACTWNALPSSNTCGGLNPSIVQGMTLAGGVLYFGQANGNLSSVSFTSGSGVTSYGTVGATATVLSGPLIDGNDWNSRALFFRSDR
jgi:hypothetical protein